MLGVPVLANHIFDIVFLCSEEKVIWIDAQRNIAGVANFHTAWDWAAAKLPSNAMREFAMKSAVLGDCRSGPEPTSFGLANFLPKSPFE